VTSFYWLRQLRRSRRSLDTDSATTLVHAFVSSRVDHCNAVLAGAPKVTTDKLQRVLNANRIAPNVNDFCRPITRINATDFIDIRQGVCPWGEKVGNFGNFFCVFGPETPNIHGCA